MNVEKRPGRDWSVVFRDTDGSLISGELYGVDTLAEAAAQAHADCAMPPECELIAVVATDDAPEIMDEIGIT